MEQHNLLPWEMVLTADDGYKAVYRMIMLISFLHLVLSFVILPSILTFLTDKKLTLSSTNRLAIKIIGLIFDTVAVVGALKEYTHPSLSSSDPLYTFSTHSQFHFSVACGYFAWATFTTLFFSRISPKNFVPLIHHICATGIYWITLHPFCHHYGNLFLLFQASTWLLDFYSIQKILNTHTNLTTVILTYVHPLTFFIVRLCIGIPLSVKFIKDMLLLLVLGNPHASHEIVFVVAGNVMMNVWNIHFFISMLLHVKGPLKWFYIADTYRTKGYEVS